LKLIISKH